MEFCLVANENMEFPSKWLELKMTTLTEAIQTQTSAAYFYVHFIDFSFYVCMWVWL